MQIKARKVAKDNGAYLLVVVALIVIGADQFTKAIIRRNLSIGETFSIIRGFVQLKGVENPGGAFGLFPGSQIFLLAVSIIVVIVAVIYWMLNRPNEPIVTMSFGLIVGGAIGNMIDRFLFNNVTDFIDFRYWPVFNIADLAIVIGMILFLNAYLKDEKRARDRSK